MEINNLENLSRTVANHDIATISVVLKILFMKKDDVLSTDNSIRVITAPQH